MDYINQQWFWVLVLAALCTQTSHVQPLRQTSVQQHPDDLFCWGSLCNTEVSSLVSDFWLNILATKQNKTVSQHQEHKKIMFLKDFDKTAQDPENIGDNEKTHLATVSKELITFSPVAALHSINSKPLSCRGKVVGFSVDVW